MPFKRPISPAESSSHSPLKMTAPPIPIPQFLTLPLATINKKHALIEAYSADILAHPDSTLTHPISHRRDRYVSIKPWAHNRIELSCLSYSYINASPVKLNRTNETFIATQGPEGSNFGATLFWRMVWQEECEVVIMLTPTFERGKERCGIYYPEAVGEVKELDQWGSVECVSQHMECGTEVKELKVIKVMEDGEKAERIVYHFHFLAWPDHDIPKTQEDQDALLTLIKMTRFRIENLGNNPDSSSERPLPPRIVHCSAGVGRTGTFIALDHLLQELEDGIWNEVSNDEDPVFETVKKMRDQRMGLVYKPVQYAFLYKVLRQQWEAKERLRNTSLTTDAAETSAFEVAERPNKRRCTKRASDIGLDDSAVDDPSETLVEGTQ